MNTFEIRKYVGGRWILDAVFDQKVIAIAEAKALMARSSSVPAVCVVQVTEDEKGFREWTVFRQSIVDEENEQAVQRAAQASREVSTARAQRAEMPRSKTPREERGVSWLYYVGIACRAIAVIGVGVFAIVMIHRQFF